MMWCTVGMHIRNQFCDSDSRLFFLTRACVSRVPAVATSLLLSGKIDPMGRCGFAEGSACQDR
jgi:hypothetical protein